ncbi:hypothetical protein K0U07_05960 [bacterium]|nr:hypothetical protein [bacterium]
MIIKYSYDRFKYKKFYGILLYKLGLKRQKILSHGEKKCIWIHATSFGETMSTKTLLKSLRERHPKCHIVFSAFTSAGYDLAKTFEWVDQVIIMPVDRKRKMRQLVNDISPDVFILTESDYWRNLLFEVKASCAKMILVGGRISDRSFKRFLLAPAFSKSLFSVFDALLLQDHMMEKKFLALGVDSTKTKVIGNIKLGVVQEVKESAKDYYLPDRKYITFGSTHKGEEDLLLTALATLPKDVVFIVVPRKPERFSEVEELLNQREEKWRFIGEKGDGDERIVFVNRLGILSDCYKKSSVAIVGGSFFDKVGGHNVFEPVKEGVPVLYGMHTYNQNSLTTLVERFGVGEACRKEEVLEKSLNLLEKGRISKEVLDQIQKEVDAVTEKAIFLINTLLKKPSVC